MDSIPLGRVLLQRVVDKLGTRAAAVHLGVEPSLVSRFLVGTIPVPDNILLRAVDIVLDELHGLATESESFSRAQR